MFFEQVLLQIIQKYDGQRTVFSAFHLLKGKKSGQTIQDVGLFDVKGFFHIMPKLKKEQYSQAIDRLVKREAVVIYEDQKIAITKNGENLLDTNKTYFNGWYFRGGEHVFFKRLQLIVQSLSNSIAGVKKFPPIIKDENVQLFVRNYLLYIQYNQADVQKAFKNELRNVLEQADLSDEAKLLLTYRLTGKNISGWTWQQLSALLKESELDIQLRYVEGIHRLIREVQKRPATSLLHPLLTNIVVKTVLTESTQKTASLLTKGYTMEQIASYRRLKKSTIEDHVAELALNDPQFNIEEFVPKHIVASILEVLPHTSMKKLKPIKDLLPDTISYFQIRLVLAWKGGVKSNA